MMMRIENITSETLEKMEDADAAGFANVYIGMHDQIRLIGDGGEPIAFARIRHENLKVAE